MAEYDDGRSLFFDLFRDLPCLGPGSDAVTLARLSHVPAPDRGGLLVDMGHLHRHPRSERAAQVAAAVPEEIDTYRATQDSYSYVFHLARRG